MAATITERLTAPQLFALARGRLVRTGDHRCWYCGGAACDDAPSAEEHVKSSFTARSTAMRGTRVCDGCLATMDERADITLLDGTHRSGQRVRCYSWLIWRAGNGWCARAATRSHRQHIASWLLDPPAPPWVCSLSDSGQKHLLYLARVCLSRGPCPNAGDALRRLVDELVPLYCQAARNLAAQAGGDATWIMFPPRGIHVRAVWLRPHDDARVASTGGTVERRLADAWLPVRYAEFAPVRPADGLDWSLGADGLVCPDCLDGTIGHAEAGTVPGFRRCRRCGSQWIHAVRDVDGVPYHVLNRATAEQQDAMVGDVEPVVDHWRSLQPPNRQALVAAAEARRELARKLREAEQRRCVELLRQQLPAHVADLLNGRGFRRGAELRLSNGYLVRFCGPVRFRVPMHESQREDVVLAQVEVLDPPQRRRVMWLAIADFV